MSTVQDGVIPAGLVIDYSTPGMKELDALAAEIDSLKRYKPSVFISVVILLSAAAIASTLNDLSWWQLCTYQWMGGYCQILSGPATCFRNLVE